jgi:hypothetical protein
MQQQSPAGGSLLPRLLELLGTLPLLLLELFFWLAIIIGFTDTLTGVGCVKNTGTSFSSSVLVAGPRMPLPMQISLILSRDGTPPSITRDTKDK